MLLPLLALFACVQGPRSDVDARRGALDALQAQAGWQDLLAPERHGAWTHAQDGAFELEPFFLRRTGQGGVDLALELESERFELEYEWRAPGEPPPPWNRVRVAAEGPRLESWENGVRTRAHGPDAGSDPTRAPILLRSHPPRLVVPGAGPAMRVRRLHVRDLTRLSGGPRALVSDNTLEGWIASGDAHWSVEDGAIRGRVGGGAQSFLRTARTFGDFVLELEFHLHGPGNSGVQVRSRMNELGRVSGYQIEIDPSPRAWTGGLYDEARRGWLQSLVERPEARAALEAQGWNRLRVECIGPWIRSWVNGVPAADHFDPLDLAGFLALQVHSGADTDLTWRGLSLWDLGRREWEDLEPSEILAGWTGTGEWEVEEVALVGRAGATLTAPHHWEDFALRLECRSQGDGGLRLRFRLGSDSPPIARQVAPALLSSPVGWTLDASDPSLSAHADGWTHVALAVFGERVVLHVGERQVADLREVTIPRTGRLVLEVGGESGLVEVRRLRRLGPPR